jgi:opacity protein-like surface antigen
MQLKGVFMRLTLFLVVLFVTLTSYVAFAQGPYAGVSGAVSFTGDSDVKVAAGAGNLSYDTGYGVGVSGGYDFGATRLEVEIGYKEADLDSLSAANLNFNITDTTLKLTTYMLNGYLDYKSDTPITMFIGAGLGMINGEFDSGNDSIDDTVFGYQASIGGSVAANKNIKIDLFYRFIGTATDFEQDDVKIDYSSSNIYLGVRYLF